MLYTTLKKQSLIIVLLSCFTFQVIDGTYAFASLQGEGGMAPKFFLNASIYNVLNLAICFNKFAFYTLNNIIDLFKNYKKFIDLKFEINLTSSKILAQQQT